MSFFYSDICIYGCIIIYCDYVYIWCSIYRILIVLNSRPVELTKFGTGNRPATLAWYFSLLLDQLPAAGTRSPHRCQEGGRAFTPPSQSA